MPILRGFHRLFDERTILGLAGRFQRPQGSQVEGWAIVAPSLDEIESPSLLGRRLPLTQEYS
jgi:hypothetical protein